MTDNKTGTGVRCVIVTPEMTILDTHSQSITVPLFDGLRGIARGHAPFIGRLGVGSVKIKGDSGESSHRTQSVFVSGGFVEVGQNTVTIITQRAIASEAIDIKAARQELAEAQAIAAAGDEAISKRFESVAAARALIRSATK